MHYIDRTFKKKIRSVYHHTINISLKTSMIHSNVFNFMIRSSHYMKILAFNRNIIENRDGPRERPVGPLPPPFFQKKKKKTNIYMYI